MVSTALAEAILSQKAPDIVGSFKKGREEARQVQVKTLTGEALKAGGGAALEQLKELDPKIALELGTSLRAGTAADIEDFVRDASVGKRLLQSGNTQGFIQFAQQRSNTLRQQGRDTAQTDRVLELARTGNSQQALDELTAFTGSLERSVDVTAKQREFEQFTRMPEGPEKDAFGRLIGAVSRRAEAEEVAAVARARAGATTGAKGEAERRQVAINKGLEAADSTANLRRALDLLDLVETGGIDAAGLRIKQVFGVEGADEGELSNRLGVAVLSQLKATFGAAFTAQEGERLERLSAGFGKSPAANRRIIEQSLAIAKRAAKRGIRAAETAGDFDTAQEIRGALEFTLTDEGEAGAPTPAPQAQAAPAAPQAQQRNISVDF